MEHVGGEDWGPTINRASCTVQHNLTRNRERTLKWDSRTLVRHTL